MAHPAHRGHLALKVREGLKANEDLAAEVYLEREGEQEEERLLPLQTQRSRA